MAMEQIPMMVEQGYRAISVVFDVWGLANLVDGKMKEGRELARQALDSDDSS